MSVFHFWDGIEHYPSWIKDHSNHVWPFVSKATKAEKPKRIDLILQDDSTFTTIEHDNTNNEDEDCKDVELYYNKEIVCAFRAEFSFDASGGQYFLSKVEFIRDGQWQKKILAFIDWEKEYSKMIEQETTKEMEVHRKNKMNKRLE